MVGGIGTTFANLFFVLLISNFYMIHSEAAFLAGHDKSIALNEVNTFEHAVERTFWVQSDPPFFSVHTISSMRYASLHVQTP